MFLGDRDEMDQHFSITAGLKNRPLRFQPMTNFQCIYQVAIVRQSHHPFVRLHSDGLRIEQRRISRGGITRVSNGQRATQSGQRFFGKDIRHQPHRLVHVQRQPIGGNDSSRLLSPMLQRVKSQIGQRLRLRVPVNRHHSAFFSKFIERNHLVTRKHFEFSNRKSKIVNQSAAAAAGSLLSTLSSAPSYSPLNSATDADTTTWPSILISTCCPTVSPMISAESPYFTAICWIPNRLPRSQEITTRLASSPNSTNSAGRPCAARFTFNPTPRGNADSASATATPPSEQSCAESTSPA